MTDVAAAGGKNSKARLESLESLKSLEQNSTNASARHEQRSSLGGRAGRQIDYSAACDVIKVLAWED